MSSVDSAAFSWTIEVGNNMCLGTSFVREYMFGLETAQKFFLPSTFMMVIVVFLLLQLIGIVDRR